MTWSFEQAQAQIPRGGAVRTRFAPSPTGYMHVGNLRTALYAYLYAKKMGGQFLLRLEDTDQGRLVADAAAIIYRTLQEAGLHYDEGPDAGGPAGPYIQTERRALYHVCAEKLIELDGAYRCFCTKSDKPQDTPGGIPAAYDGRCRALPQAQIEQKLAAGDPYVVRQKMPKTGTTTFRDLVFGDITVDNASLDDNVLIKADGLPTYNFAHVIDDYFMGVTHVIRGSEFLSSTPKYVRLYESFGWTPPVYAHASPIMRDATHKFSKRSGDPTYDDLLAQGYKPEAILNYVALLGWSPGGEQEKFSLPELVEAFDFKGLSKSPAIFDKEKLGWLSGEYIKAMEPDAFYQWALPTLSTALHSPEIDKKAVAELLRTRVEKLSDIPGLVGFLNELPEYDNALYNHTKMKTNPANARTALHAALPALDALPLWTKDAVHDALMAVVGTLGCKTGQVLWPVRVALSGLPSTPGGGVELCALLGKQESLRRLRVGLEQLGDS